MKQKKDFDSTDEYEFYIWLKKSGVKFKYHPTSLILSDPVPSYRYIQLKTKVKKKEYNLLQGCCYTADFKIKKKNLPSCLRDLKISGNDCWIDIKPSFLRFHDGKSFSILQKWIYQRHGIYINKVNVNHVFKNSFVPKEIAFCLNGSVRKKYQGMIIK